MVTARRKRSCPTFWARSPGRGNATPISNRCSKYGSRAGLLAPLADLHRAQAATTVFGVATALKRNPEIVAAMKEAGWDIASHSLKWVEHKDMSEAEERRRSPTRSA